MLGMIMDHKTAADVIVSETPVINAVEVYYHNRQGNHKKIMKMSKFNWNMNFIFFSQKKKQKKVSNCCHSN